MEVTGPGAAPGSSPVRPAESPPSVSKPGEVRPAASHDEVEISPAARMFDKLNNSSEVRAERLARIKAEIEAGRYETPEKLEAALLKLMDEVGLNDDDSD